jgi:hypothetical protein
MLGHYNDRYLQSTGLECWASDMHDVRCWGTCANMLPWQMWRATLLSAF